MRPNRIIRRTIGAAFLAALAVGALGCGKKAPMESLDAKVSGDLVVVEGTLTLRGTMPYPDMFLVMEDGTEVIIESKKLRGELRNLGGLPVAIEGKMKSMRNDLPRVEATRYELLRLSTGEIPLVGILGIEGGALVLAATDGKRYWIRGDLVTVIGDYVGARVWIVGSKGDAGAAKQPPGAEAYWVTGYGVLNEEPE